MWSPWEGARGWYARARARHLVNECESFLVGEYPSVLQRRGLPVPEWAWLSVLAHAPAEGLIQIARGTPRRRPGERVHTVWLDAVALLALELVMAAERTGCSIAELQHDVILKMELDWIGPEGSSIGPSRFVEQVHRELHRFRGTSPHTR